MPISGTLMYNLTFLIDICSNILIIFTLLKFSANLLLPIYLDGSWASLGPHTSIMILRPKIRSAPTQEVKKRNGAIGFSFTKQKSTGILTMKTKASMKKQVIESFLDRISLEWGQREREGGTRPQTSIRWTLATDSRTLWAKGMLQKWEEIIPRQDVSP